MLLSDLGLSTIRPMLFYDSTVTNGYLVCLCFVIKYSKFGLTTLYISVYSLAQTTKISKHDTVQTSRFVSRCDHIQAPNLGK